MGTGLVNSASTEGKNLLANASAAQSEARTLSDLADQHPRYRDEATGVHIQLTHADAASGSVATALTRAVARAVEAEHPGGSADAAYCDAITQRLLPHVQTRMARIENSGRARPAGSASLTPIEAPRVGATPPGAPPPPTTAASPRPAATSPTQSLSAPTSHARSAAASVGPTLSAVDEAVAARLHVWSAGHAADMVDFATTVRGRTSVHIVLSPAQMHEMSGAGGISHMAEWLASNQASGTDTNRFHSPPTAADLRTSAQILSTVLQQWDSRHPPQE